MNRVRAAAPLQYTPALQSGLPFMLSQSIEVANGADLVDIGVLGSDLLVLRGGFRADYSTFTSEGRAHPAHRLGSAVTAGAAVTLFSSTNECTSLAFVVPNGTGLVPRHQGQERCAPGEADAVKRALLLGLAVAACSPLPVQPDASVELDAGAHEEDAGIDAGHTVDAGTPPEDAGMPDAGPPDPFADVIVSFTPGPGAGFGQNKLPGVVLGPPRGEGNSSGSLDVLSLGNGGSIVLELDDIVLVDGPGVDLLVFENPFSGFIETGVVAVSEDGGEWFEWPCAAETDGGTEGCAGVTSVYSSPENGISATDPGVSGGDGFDLSLLGVSRARFVRVRDSGKNSYGAPGGGFDLDAISVVNGAPR